MGDETEDREATSELGRFQQYWPTEPMGATMQEKSLPREAAKKQSAI